MRELIDYDAFSILLVDHEAKALRHLFSIRYDQRVNIDNVPLGKGHHRRGGGIARSGARARYRKGPALHRLAPGYPLGSGGAADRAGSRGGRDGSGERPRRLLHATITCGRWRCWRRRWRAAWRTRGCTSNWPTARAAHGGRPEGGARTAAHAAAGRRTGDRRPGSGGAPAAGARNLGRHLRHLRTARTGRR